MKSIKNKLSADGVDHEHSSAMKKEHMDKILTWAKSDCPEIRSALHFIYVVLTKAPASGVHIGDDVKKRVTRRLEFLAFALTAWIIWTRYGNDGSPIYLGLPRLSRCCELMKLKCGDIQMDNAWLDSVLVKYMRGEQDALTIDDMDVCCEIHLQHQKGWQKKEDKSFREIDLRGKHWNFDGAMLLYPNLTAANHYQIFPQPDLTSCDTFFWLLIWIRWVEYVHLVCPMADGGFIFPAVGENRVVQPGEPLTQDSVQKMLSEATAASGIEGKYLTHCFCRGGVQHWFIHAPNEEKWTMDVV